MTIGEEGVLAQFDAAVAAYVALYRRIECSLPPQRISDNAEEIFVARDRLRSAVRAGRGVARKGDIFTPAVAAVIVERLARTIAAHRHDPADILADLNEERAPGLPEPRVNGAFP